MHWLGDGATGECIAKHNVYNKTGPRGAQNYKPISTRASTGWMTLHAGKQNCRSLLTVRITTRNRSWDEQMVKVSLLVSKWGGGRGACSSRWNSDFVAMLLAVTSCSKQVAITYMGQYLALLDVENLASSARKQ